MIPAPGLLEALIADAAERAAALAVDRALTRIERAVSEQRESRTTLAEYIGISRKAAAARIARESALRALGLPTGRGGQLTFRRSDLEAYYAGKDPAR